MHGNFGAYVVEFGRGKQSVLMKLCLSIACMRLPFVIEIEIHEMELPPVIKITKAFERNNFRQNLKSRSVKLLFKIKN